MKVYDVRKFTHEHLCLPLMLKLAKEENVEAD